MERRERQPDVDRVDRDVHALRREILRERNLWGRDGLAQNDPAAAYVAGLPAGDAQNKAAVSVIGQWTQTEPEDASKWAANFTGELRQEAIDAVMQNWMHSDPQSSAQWLAALPDDAVKQSAMLSYIVNSASQYPGLAATFVPALTDEQRRATAINDIANSWLRTDPKAAAEWLKKTALPPDQIQRLLDGVQK